MYSAQAFPQESSSEPAAPTAPKPRGGKWKGKKFDEKRGKRNIIADTSKKNVFDFNVISLLEVHSKASRPVSIQATTFIHIGLRIYMQVYNRAPKMLERTGLRVDMWLYMLYHVYLVKLYLATRHYRHARDSSGELPRLRVNAVRSALSDGIPPIMAKWLNGVGKFTALGDTWIPFNDAATELPTSDKFWKKDAYNNWSNFEKICGVSWHTMRLMIARVKQLHLRATQEPDYPGLGTSAQKRRYAPSTSAEAMESDTPQHDIPPVVPDDGPDPDNPFGGSFHREHIDSPNGDYFPDREWWLKLQIFFQQFPQKLAVNFEAVEGSVAQLGFASRVSRDVSFISNYHLADADLNAALICIYQWLTSTTPETVARKVSHCDASIRAEYNLAEIDCRYTATLPS